jgi:hypothetical protein
MQLEQQILGRGLEIGVVQLHARAVYVWNDRGDPRVQ